MRGYDWPVWTYGITLVYCFILLIMMIADIQQQSIVESDSQNSSEEQLEGATREHQVQNDGDRFDWIIVCILLLIGICSVVTIVLSGRKDFKNKDNSMLQSQGTQEYQQSRSRENIVSKQGIQADIVRPKNKVSNLSNNESFPLNEDKMLLNMTLRSIQSKDLLTNTYFIYKDLYKGNMQWYQNQHLICQNDLTVNTASKIAHNRYLQKTAYQHLNCLYQTVTIPAQNIYRFQSIRQFLSNITKKHSQYIIAFDHGSPLLLIIATTMSSKGLFVNSQLYWPLFQQNLIMNDLLPLANQVNMPTLTEKGGYHILITNNLTMLEILLFQQKRQIIVILHLQEPKKMHTYMLRKLNFFKFLQGKECSPRQIQAYEESTWRIQDQSWLLPNIYIVTLSFVHLTLDFQQKHYEKPLFLHRDFKCIQNVNYKSESYPIGQGLILLNVPYSGLFLVKQKLDNKIDKNHYRQVVSYWLQFPIEQRVYLESGSYYIFLLLVSFTGKQAQIYLNPQYPDSYMLNKNLVINNLQKVQLFEKQKAMNYSLIITTNLTSLQSIPFQKALLVVQQKHLIDLTKYKAYGFSVKQQCKKSIISPLMGPQLSEGVYVITKF